MMHNICCQRLAVALLFLLVFCLNSALVAESLAVMELSAPLTSEDKGVLTQKIVDEFLKTAKYEVMERAEIDNVLAEQGFQQTGVSSQETAVKVGQLLNVRFMVLSKIGKIGALYSISMRMVDAQSGKIISTATYENSKNIEDVMVSGIPKTVAILVGSKTRSQVYNDDSRIRSSIRLKRVVSWSTLALGIGSAALAGFSLAQYNTYSSDYKNATSDFSAIRKNRDSNWSTFLISGSLSGMSLITSGICFIARVRESDRAIRSTALFDPCTRSACLRVSISF